jgi:site-specific DNA-methyltransferase (adenine-specific)
MFDKKPYELLYGDCYELLKSIPNNSVDMVLTDPPYGQTPLEWDKGIDLNALWYHIKRICKPDACICVFAQEPFASHLRLSNLSCYKYDWYWKKERPTNIFQVKRRPAKYVKNICVFL